MKPPKATKTVLRTRIAPTPSGFLHLGNAASFVLTWALARAQGGEVALRIDDLDAARMRAEYLDDIFETLDWLGLDWDFGPSSAADFTKNYSQHLRLDDYKKMLRELVQQGGIYACACSRKDILSSQNALKTGNLYLKTCRNAQIPLETAQAAWRISVDSAAAVSFHEFREPEKRACNLSETMGDFVVRSKNGFPSYQMASLADDVFLGTNFVVRGSDLLPSTQAQVFLAKTLGLETFAETTFLHHRLILGAQGEKLSKSAGAASVRTAREQGLKLSEIYATAANFAGIKVTNTLDLNTFKELIRAHFL
jgi:glutamyl/glutaminyl-tRNA synthetase